MSQHLSTCNISSKSMNTFLSNLANRQTDRQTEIQTNVGKRIYLLFVGGNNCSCKICKQWLSWYSNSLREAVFDRSRWPSLIAHCASCKPDARRCRARTYSTNCSTHLCTSSANSLSRWRGELQSTMIDCASGELRSSATDTMHWTRSQMNSSFDSNTLCSLCNIHTNRTTVYLLKKDKTVWNFSASCIPTTVRRNLSWAILSI